MLSKLRSQLDQLVGPLPDGMDLEGLDQYLLDLNTFYYQSFHHHFMPRYRQAFEDDLRRIHKLSRSEQSLQTDLINVLRFYIKVYNQTGLTARQLKERRSEVNLRRLALQAGTETRTVDLLYLLKEHVEAWVRFANEVDVARSLKADKPLLATLERFPACSLAASLFRTGNFQDGKDKRDFNRLLSQWQLGLRLLARMQADYNQNPAKELMNSLVDELEKVDASWDSRKAVPAVREWYKQNVQPGYHLYLETLRSYGGRMDPRRFSRMAAQFQDWLQAWLNTLEYYTGLQARGWDEWLDRLPALISLDEDFCLELADFGLRGRRSLDELISSLAASQAGSYDSFSQSSRQILTEAGRYLHKLPGSPAGSLSALRLTVQKLSSEVEMALRGIDLLDERENHAREAMVTYRDLQLALDTGIGILDSFSAQIEHMLDSRALKNRFEDMAPDIEHVAVRTGAMLPPGWAGLAEKGRIGTQVSEAPQGLVLHAEGDIFVIRLGEQVYEEIPKIIVSRKG